MNQDPIFKQTLIDVLSREGVEVETEVEVGRLPRTIDGIVTVKDEAVLPTLAAETPFAWFGRHNIIAFKGANDPLDQHDFHLVMSRTCLSLAEKRVDASHATLTIICGRTPRKEMARYRQEWELIEVSEGVFQIGRYPPLIYLVVINELPVHDPRYDMLHSFTSQRRHFHEFILEAFGSGRYEVVNIAALVRPSWIQELMMISTEMIPQENLDILLKWIERDFLHQIPADKRMAGLPLEQRLAGLNAEERAALLRLLLEERS